MFFPTVGSLISVGSAKIVRSKGAEPRKKQQLENARP